uniref:Myomesin 2a n=1 Tax=Gadus morhua TaxID=8049 RepID=A0A8C5CFR2_GADMO
RPADGVRGGGGHVVMERKSTCNSVSQVKAQATEAMAEPAYTVPEFRQRSTEEVEEYQRVSTHVGKGLAAIQEELHRMRMATKAQVDNLAIKREVPATPTLRKVDLYEEGNKLPDFLVALRPHTVWEKTPVKLYCTVHGHPRPVVSWFKDGVPVNPLNAPGKYKIESKYGVHGLIISRSAVSDTAEYSAVASNPFGTATSKATVTVKIALLLHPVPRLTQMHPSKLEVTLLERFSVSFGVEGGSISLACSMVVVPDLPNLPPLAHWYRDDHLMKAGPLAEMKVGGGLARLNLPRLAKDDEGLYTLRIYTKEGTTEHSAYLFVQDAVPSVAGAPGAPMSVKVFDINMDFALVSWKPPNTTNEAAVSGYFVDRLAGSDHWVQCNDTPVKVCKYPVTGLTLGQAVHFRVRAVNSAGISRPSRRSQKVTAADPAESELVNIRGHYDILIRDDDLEGSYVTIPGEPTSVHASEVYQAYVVLSWTPPTPRGRARLWYIIEKVSGTEEWTRINTGVKVQSPRYPIFDLLDGKSYQFRVFSANQFGSSEASAPTGPVQKADEHGVPSTPGQVVATRNTKSSVFVQWEASKVPNSLLGYYIDARPAGSKLWQPCNHKPFRHTRFVVHGLVPGETYVFRVQAVNLFGLSAESQESSPIAVEPALGVEYATPSSPFGITLLSCNGSSMTLAWKSPKHCGGSHVNAYYVDRRNADKLQWKEVNVSAIKERVYTVEGLTEGNFYEFKVQAGNMAGVGVPSEASKPMKCEAWTMAEPGPAFDLSFSEVRSDSLVILWKAPVYTGASAVTGYLVEMAKKGSSDFTAVNQDAVSHRYLQVGGLEAGETYVFRVRSVNADGVGKASQVSEPILAKALPGNPRFLPSSLPAFLPFPTTLFISLFVSFHCIKSYPLLSRLTFTSPDKDDLGRYSVVVTDTDGVSASHTLTEDALNTMLELSHAIRNPIVPLKHGLNYEILEKGHVRFWLQATKLSAAASYRFIVNDKEVTSGEGQKISHDAKTGVIQMTVEHFTRANEGTYTVQIHDGKAKNQTSLVLVGDVFKAALTEAEFQRKEHLRKLGPHFSEYLYFTVAEDCTVLLACKVANVKKETKFTWYKEDEEIVLETAPNAMSGSVALPIPQFSRKDQGVYKATLSDDKGKDTSLFEVSGQVFDDIINAIAKIAGTSASELVLQCTPEGIRLQCYMTYYTEEMKTVWKHRDSKIASSEKMRIGGTAEMAWMQICDPSDKEKGQYTIEISDGVNVYARSFDLSGQEWMLRRLLMTQQNRGRVVGGLPDVVTIMEHKSLSLTCTVWGEPTPEVTWFKNEQEVASCEHTKVTFEGGKFASLVITQVTSDDSGKYSINVRNKYGGEFVEITVSVYRHGEPIPEPKLGQPKTAAPAASKTSTPTPSMKSPTPSMKSPTPSMKSPTPASTPVPKSPTPGPKSPTPTRSVKSPTPTSRFLKSPTPK